MTAETVGWIVNFGFFFPPINIVTLNLDGFDNIIIDFSMLFQVSGYTFSYLSFKLENKMKDTFL